MKIQELIPLTRTVHRYQNRPVPTQLIQEALELSLAAPNHKFTFPWKYYWPGPQTKQKLYEMALENAKVASPDMDAEQIENLKEKMLYPEILFFAQKNADNDFTQKEDYATIACSVQIFAMALAEHGIGYKWSTGKIAFDPKVHELIGIPENEEVAGMILCGYQFSEPGPKRRPELGDVLVRTS